ncbi:MAG: hypothetical protein IJH12_04165 [Clostridia bacterium]|nr:hypothetical protein [Clostridia bacterium]
MKKDNKSLEFGTKKDGMSDRKIKKEINTIKEDIENGIVTPDQIIEACLSKKKNQFNRKFDDFCKVKIGNGRIREYSLYSVVDFIREYLSNDALPSLSTFVYAYEVFYNPESKITVGEKYKKEIKDVENFVKDTARMNYKDYGQHGDNEIDQKRERQIHEKLIERTFVYSFLMAHNYKNVFDTTAYTGPIEDFARLLLDCCVNSIRACSNFDDNIKFRAFSLLFSKDEKLLSKDLEINIKPLSDQDVMLYIEGYLNEEEFREFIINYGENVLARKKVVEFFTGPKPKNNKISKAGIFTKEELKKLVNKDNIEAAFKITHDKELLDYLSKEQIMSLYIEGHIDNSDIRRLVNSRDVILAQIDADVKIQILTGRGKKALFINKETELIWQKVENDELAMSDLKQLEQYGYFSISSIIDQYTENQKRKIAEELGELPVISNSKLLEYFTPNVIIDYVSKKISPEQMRFVCSPLKSIYEENGQNMEQLVRETLIEKYKDDSSQIQTEGFLLYEKGILSAKSLVEMGITSDEAEKYCQNHGNDENVLIEFFNEGLITQDEIYNIYGNNFDEKALELISNGMSSKVIEGLYSTLQLVEYARETVDENGEINPPKLSLENLAIIKDDINVGIDEKGVIKSAKSGKTLLDLYLSDQLTYAELYNMANAGIISIDIANEINEKYNIIKDWESLKKVGVQGNPIEDLITPQNSESNSGTSSSRDVVGIDEGCIIDFYVALGAEEYLEIDAKKCPVFKDYIVIPIMDMKVAYLEGKDGRTYIVPLKIVLEQINNPNGTMDLIGNAASRNGFNSNKKHIRSANHTRNWGRRVVEKTADLPSIPMNKEDANNFLRANHACIKAIENSYDSRKYTIKDQAKS